MERLRLMTVYVFAAVLIGVVPGLFVSNSRKFKEVSIKIDPGSSISIYKDRGKGSAPQYSPNSKPLFRLAGSSVIRLKEGLYVSVLGNSDHLYQKPVSVIQVDPDTTTITINQNYSPQTLASLLPGARAQAIMVLNAAYPASVNTYSITSDGLYQKGDWYGAVITPQSPNQDTVRIILHKVSGSWIIAASPNISIGEPSHPNIPPAVIEAVDQL